MVICPLIPSNLKQRTLNKYDAFYTYDTDSMYTMDEADY
jgi:hypothetical protein